MNVGVVNVLVYVSFCVSLVAKAAVSSIISWSFRISGWAWRMYLCLTHVWLKNLQSLLACKSGSLYFSGVYQVCKLLFNYSMLQVFLGMIVGT